MAKALVLRPLSDEERKVLEKLAKSQTAPVRMVERAKTILWVYAGEQPLAIAQKLERATATIYQRLKRFAQNGLDSLDDQPRAGRPLTYTEEERGQMIVSARTHPHQLGRPYNHWTLDRLVEYVNQELKIAISRAQLARVLEEEGLRWYQEETYFTERPDPQFVEKRGP
ncbi:MAG TPA: helix-turn-helix domain-containing protein [Candidatus Binatia bacterium]|nr:helix-turn-helix domain-containing protein [Candidatus Binatia bacterium]